MRFRKLRIGWSIMWGLAFVLMIVLWVRSYTSQDAIGGRFDRITFQVGSGRARLVAQVGSVPGSDGGLSFKVNSELINDTAVYDADLSEMSNKLGFGLFQDPSPTVIIPHWFAAFIAATLAAMPWIRWSKRFTLRTLLIATTLVAVVLGLAVYATRK